MIFFPSFRDYFLFFKKKEEKKKKCIPLPLYLANSMSEKQ
jgi:hypothetical protein